MYRVDRLRAWGGQARTGGGRESPGLQGLEMIQVGRSHLKEEQLQIAVFLHSIFKIIF